MNTTIFPFKNRTVNPAKPVRVYRNLHGNAAHRYSLMQDGLVVAHGCHVILTDARFLVNEAGRQRVLVEKRKNVHAFVVGTLVDSLPPGPRRTYKVRYNPYFAPTFMVGNVVPIKRADTAVVNNEGIQIVI